MSNKMLDRLLDENWLSEANWNYYNRDEKLVRDVLKQVRFENTRDKIAETSAEEMLSIEMRILKDLLQHQLTQIYQSSGFLSLAELGITKDLGQMNLNELIQNRERVVKWCHDGNYYKSPLIDPRGSKVRRAEVYSCPREVSDE